MALTHEKKDRHLYPLFPTYYGRYVGLTMFFTV